MGQGYGDGKGGNSGEQSELARSLETPHAWIIARPENAYDGLEYSEERPE